MRSTSASHLTLLAVAVAIHLPSSAVSMETENGYLCNLCHGRQNDHPYPPPDAEDTVVQFTQSQVERFGMPWDRGITCLEVWNTVLDYANPNVTDEASCRSMAEAYAPQCCNDIDTDSSDDEDEAVDEPRRNPMEQQQESNEEEGVVGASSPSSVKSSTITTQSQNTVRRTATISYLRGQSGTKRN